MPSIYISFLGGGRGSFMYVILTFFILYLYKKRSTFNFKHVALILASSFLSMVLLYTLGAYRFIQLTTKKDESLNFFDFAINFIPNLYFVIHKDLDTNQLS